MPKNPLDHRPNRIRAEVKFTTGTAVHVPARELGALLSPEPASLGLVACLFWCGDRATDGRWLMVDAAGLVRPGAAPRSHSLTKDEMLRLARTQRYVDWLRTAVNENWPRLLAAFREVAAKGHEPLLAALQECSQQGSVASGLPSYAVLEAEHRESVQAIVDELGESSAGRVFQDLFAYLLALPGYRMVTINAVGVPDVQVENPAWHDRPQCR